MVDTRSVAFKSRVDRFIKNCYKGSGGVSKNLIAEMDYRMSPKNAWFYNNDPYRASLEYIVGGANHLPLYRDEVIEAMKHFGYTDHEINKMPDLFGEYERIMAQGCVRIWKDYKAKHTVTKKNGRF